MKQQYELGQFVTVHGISRDPDFAKVYLEEKRLLLDVLTLADETLMLIARKQTEVIE